MFLLACLGSTAGMMAFTLQQTICISTCPPDYPYFPQVKVGTATLAWSFYIGWVGSGKALDFRSGPSTSIGCLLDASDQCTDFLGES